MKTFEQNFPLTICCGAAFEYQNFCSECRERSAAARPEPDTSYAQRGGKITLGEVLIPAFFVLGFAVFAIGMVALGVVK